MGERHLRSGQRSRPQFRAVRIVFSTALLSGLATLGSTLVVTSAAQATTLTTTQVTVSVNTSNPWTDSGYSVPAGSPITFSASGTATGFGTPDPSGTPAGTPWPVCGPALVEGSYGPPIAPGLPCWSLIGRFGTTGPAFEIGDSASIDSGGGELYLGVNDNYFPDNHGTWTVKFEIASGPFSVTPDGNAVGPDAWGGGGGVDTNCDCAAGQPVNLSTGDYFDTQSDLTIPGAGIPLTFNRTYDAEAAQTDAAASAAAGPLGYGWSDNLSMSISDASGVATVTQADDSEVNFRYYSVGSTEPTGSGGATWCPSDASAGVWCPTAPRYIATLSGASGGTGGPWTFTNEIGSPITYSFTSAGVLSEISDATGDTLTSSAYSPGTGQATCPSGDSCTAWSSTPDGESSPVATLVEAFNSSNQLVSVFDAASGASSTQAATFAYSGTGCSTWTGTPTDLCSATDPGSLTTTFTYDTAKSSPYQYDETSMTPPATGQVANTYNASGQVTKQMLTTGATNQEQDFAYATYSGVTDGTQTTVNGYPNGSGGISTTATYIFSNGVEVGESNGITATTSVVRDPATLLADETIDGNGYVTTAQNFYNYAMSGNVATSADVTQTTIASGGVTESLYTPANQPWCTLDPADYDNAITCPATEPTTPPAVGTHIGYTLDIYNAANEVTYTTDPLGNTTVNSYTTSGSGVPVGLLYCSVDPADYAKGVACPAYGATHVMGTATKTFDANGDVLTSTDADGNVTSSTYGSAANPGLPTLTTDPDGQQTADVYNAQGEVLTQTVTDTSGTYSATTQYAYDSAGRKFCEVDPLEYANSIRCPSSPPTSPPTGTPGYTDTIYNTNGQVISTTNPIGGTTQNAYDGSGNLYCTVSPSDYASSTRCPTMTMLPLTTPTVSSDLYPGATITTFDADNRVVQTTNPVGGITANVYDNADNLTQRSVESNSTSAPNVVTATTYNADNQPVSQTVGYGSSSPETTLTNYDPDGNAFCTVSANVYAAGSSTYQCPAWQPAWIATPPSPTSLYSTSPTSAQANNVTTTFFDADGNQVQTTNPDVQTSTTVFDADGRTYCTSDPTNVATYLTAHSSATYPYNCPSTSPTSPPTTGSDPGYVTTIFDAVGNTLSSTNADGDTTNSTYDPAGNVLTATDPRGEVTSNCYYGQSASGQCAHGAPVFGGSADALYSTTTPDTSADPSGETTTYTYFPGDLTETTTTPASTATTAYDAKGDVASTSYSGIASGYSTPADTSAAYNVDGSKHTMTDATGTTTYGYDAMGDVTSQALVATGGLSSATTSYLYYSNGDLDTLTYPAYSGYSSPTVTYAYDATGAMVSSSDWLGNEVTFGHDADGNQTSQGNDVSTSNPSGTSSTAQTYDAADNLKSAVSTMNQTCGGSETLTQSFSGSTGSRNPDNQLTSATNTYSGSCSGQPGSTLDYSYDTAGQVTYQGTSPQGASPATFGYDASGDPTTLTSHASSGGSTDTYTQGYDAAGEVTSQTPVSGSGGSTSSFGHDTLGDQTSVSGATSSTYGYNAAGQMASDTSGAISTNYLYDGNGLETSATTAATSPPSWQSAADVDSTRAIKAVSCVSATFCVAAGTGGDVVMYNGTSWSVDNVDSTRTLDAVSCASTSFCVAVDTAGYEVTYSGSSWSSTPSDIDGSQTIEAVSCASSSLCMAVGTGGYVSLYTGSTWTTTHEDGTNTLNGVSCPTSTFCAAVGDAGYAVTYTSSGGLTLTDADATRALDAVSCSSSTFCMAVGSTGYAVAYTGTWQTPAHPDLSTRTLTSVSCTSTSFCEAVDRSGYATTYSGTSWSAMTDADGTDAFRSISCESSTLCVAVDTIGFATTFSGGTTWSTPIDIDASRAPSSLSCASTTFCATVDNSGYAVLWAPGTSASSNQLVWSSDSALPLVLADSSNYYIYGPGTTPVEQVDLVSSTPTYLTYTPSEDTWVSTNEVGDETGYWGYDAYGTLMFGTPTSPFGYSGQYSDLSTGFVNDRARWYEPQVGGFTTRDPASAATDTAYTYAGDDPVNNSDPTGLDYFLTVSATTARTIGHFFNGAQVSLQVFDSSLGPAGAAAVWALDYLNRLIGQSNFGDPLITAASQAERAAANSGRHQPSQGIVTIDIQTVSIFGWDTGIPTGSYSAIGTSRKARTTAEITGCGNEVEYV